jgi:photosystem II stability/assembly factor-like uncharacterized protein
MKNLIYTLTIALTFLVFNDFLFAQDIPESVITKNNLSSTSTFFEIQKAMNEYWESQNVQRGFKMVNGAETKVPGWKPYKRWEYYWEQRVNQITGEFPKTTSVDEYEKYKRGPYYSPRNTDYTESWTNLGTNTSAGGYAGLGRINCVAFHPTDANTFWVGSPSGGIWKTTNGGTNWTILNNNLSVLGVSVIVIPSDYATSNTIYIATGDRDGGSMWSLGGGQNADNASIGIYKSTDGGATWNVTGLTYTTSQKKLVYSLVIDPSNNSILFAATSDGLYKTINGGTNWTSKEANAWNDIEFKPGDPTIMYATNLINYGNTYMVRSTNSGETWTFFIVAAGRRGEIAVTPADPSVVYLLSANSSGGVFGVYKSTNSGANFSVVNSGSPAGMLGYYTDGSGGSGGQGSYDWCISAKPDDANTVFIGGITTWKSTNGGTTFTANTNWTSSSFYNKSGVPVTHADKHALVYQNNSILFEGNDGGIYKTTNGGTNWTDLSNGLVISQIYRIGVSQTSSTTVITGLQDNGSKLFNGSWSDVTGGDGMECIVDYSTTQYMYATYVTGTIYRSINSGASFPVTISANIPGGQPTGAWVTPYIIDPNSSSTLYAGYDQVWKTANRGNNWTSASQVLSSGDKLRSLAIAPSNSNVLYTADRTNMWKTIDDGATNWTSVTLPAITDYITYIAVKNTDPNTLWFTCGGFTSGSKVFESTNGGTNWTNISTGLPNLPTMCIVQNKHATDRNVLFVGMDVGVYVKNGTDNWVSYSNGLPGVVVSELDIYYNINAAVDKLRAGTFGRGLWETTIEIALPVELTSFTCSVDKNTVYLNWETESEINNKGFDIERKIKGTSKWQKVGFVEGKGNSNQNAEYSFTDLKLNTGKYNYRLKQIDFNGNYEYHNLSGDVSIGIPDKFSISQNYPNPFNPNTKIDYEIPVNGKVTIKIYNVLGMEIINLVDEIKNAGYYTAEFDGTKIASGVYFYRISVSGENRSYNKILKMTLVK